MKFEFRVIDLNIDICNDRFKSWFFIKYKEKNWGGYYNHISTNIDLHTIYCAITQRLKIRNYKPL